jgi:DNA repair photolyase
MSAQPLLLDVPASPSLRTLPGGATLRTRRSTQIVARGVGRTRPYHFTLNPYVGCQFGCSYCYAAFFVPDESKARDWGRWVESKENALELLARRRDLAGKRIYVGSATDPYQPVEARLRLTRRILERLATLDPQPSVVVQTRSPLVVEDAPLLKRFQKARINITLTTDDDAVRKRFEPACPSIEARFRAIAELKLAGFRVACCVTPMLPVSDPVGFAVRLERLQADRYAFGYFHPPGRPFSAGTREQGLALAAELGWTEGAFRKSIDAMRSACPSIFGRFGAFLPE